ncbi:MBL fold metallo-hydrolase [Deinococcus yavapaiensis]|uniref:Glyoxylase-like metal-dependent hydrolase (Beta-lactamase superfamily II) n=1 Tax=Deinococcus yavapaiensis KR-236 TaxID=694435 RepID=A0A318S4L9_9DEIO|nr:MBL fold metallo-hydrolase [Deinococcus yavapaiensis]PYE53027.1 glyoxylase-like metal-dependent hydrolase (beta-lactamase superfamily II) [Deinococcus yavapaiensis KR-236]
MWLHSLTVGEARVTSLSDGFLRLDGGAMFGVVPKNLWSKLHAPDEQNRVALRINPLLIQLGGKNVLVETGMWDRGGEKFEAIYGVERDTTVFDGLRAMGLAPSDIDLVINTHLHFDHAGRNTTALGRPTFERARYVVQAQELHDALHPHDRARASYIPEIFEPLAEAGVFEIVEGEAELLAGLSVLPLPGHNLGQQGVVLRSEGQTLVCTADLMPTLAHAPYPYVMGYDLYPVTCVDVRQTYFPRWAEEGAIIAPPHDPRIPFAKFEANPKGGYVARPLH